MQSLQAMLAREVWAPLLLLLGVVGLVLLTAYANVANLLFVRAGLALTLLGSAIGVAGAMAVTRLFSSLLVGVSPTDPLTFAAVVGLTVVVGLFGCYLPSRRAVKVDPMLALRAQ